jgi:flagellar biosynthesis/type III secretory pathway M-ring protein FliF/YscJ
VAPIRRSAPSRSNGAGRIALAAEIALALLLVAVVAWFVTAPLRRAEGRDGAGEGAGATEDPAIADLEARKEAKYREIRDAELDREQGKLSDADWRRQDAELRRQAIEILKRLDRARGEPSRARGEPSRARGEPSRARDDAS